MRHLSVTTRVRNLDVWARRTSGTIRAITVIPGVVGRGCDQRALNGG